MRIHVRGIAILALFGSVGCATSQFDRHFEAQRYAEAARVFEADSSLKEKERALYRIGLAYALPRSPIHQPKLAREHFEKLLTLFPGTSYRGEVGRLLELLGEMEELESHAAKRDAEVKELTAEIAKLQGQARALEATLREREGQLRALQEELKRLKEIDLKPSRPAGKGPKAKGRAGSAVRAPPPARP